MSYMRSRVGGKRGHRIRVSLETLLASTTIRISRMSSATMTQTHPAHRGGRKGKGRGGRGGSQGQNGLGRTTASKTPEKPADGEIKASEPAQKVSNNITTTPETEADEGALCWICAEPVKYWSLSECNHRTCHVCALRLRALYKKQECTFCKVRERASYFC